MHDAGVGVTCRAEVHMRWLGCRAADETVKGLWRERRPKEGGNVGDA